jgi:GntR family transcriptional repressor for pyruvate dehydrogenase complex
MFANMSNPTEYLIHYVLFHRIISQASGNPILAALMETITTALCDTCCRQSRGIATRGKSPKCIARSIRIHGRKPLEAREFMEQHLRAARAARTKSYRRY